MREVELKAVLDSWNDRRALIIKAGATLAFAGRLEDRRYDTHDRSLAARDIVLRLRTYRDASGARTQLEFKGPSASESGYKVREEVGSTVLDAESIAVLLAGLGYVVTRGIDREIEQFELDETIVRFERYPRMDDLVEVEGEPGALERAIVTLGLPRAAFTAERLTDFAARYEARTGQRAAVADAELSGNAPPVREF
ncbi:MAG TPA: CYTH domain-containing protein [Gemmatimonadaceae bacterium]|jgi:adenylate cyclase class IV|nr:CYTH domain-containing protein [Gemmatimonadaceae bacterium]